MLLVPRRFFLTRGVGFHKDKLGSFEMALRDSGIEVCNLVSVSSILPPLCEEIPAEQGIEELKSAAGAITFCVMSRIESDEPHRMLSAAIGVAKPMDNRQYGYLSEYHPYGMTEEECGDYAEDLAAEMYASARGLEIDVDKAYLEQEDLWLIGGERVKTFHIARADSAEKGYWCSVLAAAVFLF